MATCPGLVAILEKYQDADGGAIVPKALRPDVDRQERLVSATRWRAENRMD